MMRKFVKDLKGIAEVFASEYAKTPFNLLVRDII